VNLPYAGSVYLSGLTISEATTLLTEKLGQYIKIPGMTIMITSYGPRQIYVMGEVSKPGIYELRWDRMNIISALSSAGGIGLRGHPKHVQVVRMVNNQIETKEINFKKLLQKGDLTQNLELRDGDLIYVPNSGRIDFNTDILPFVNLYLLYKAATN
jgi:polysaccharide export outer membrane protein